MKHDSDSSGNGLFLGLTVLSRVDYSEEAIAERDPAYCLPHGTDHLEQTVEVLTVAVRRELACRLQELGMIPARATVLAAL